MANFLLNLRILTLLFVGCMSHLAYSQVTGVKYGVHKNAKNGHFDCYIYISEGEAKSAIHRTQFNAQYSVLVPAGSAVSMAERFMPLQDNQTYNGHTPCEWRIASVVRAPQIMPDKDFYGIIPSMGPTSQYNDIKAGDTIKLFSLSVIPSPKSSSEVRLFENNKDPVSSDAGMSGANFANGFTIGGLTQLYKGNFEFKQKNNSPSKK
jgi:hypothetical protein